MKTKSLTEGSITKTLIFLAIPIMLSNIFHTIYDLTDTFWVGRLGSEAIAAVSVTSPIIFLLITIGGGIAMGGSIFIAQYKGKNEHSKIDFITGQSLFLMLIAGLLVSIIGYFLTDIFINAMNPEASVAVNAIKFLKVSFLGIPFTFIFMGFVSTMRSTGFVKVPLYIVTVSVFLNFFLDPLFIMGYGPIPAYGVAGAAIATVITEAILAIIGTYFLIRGTFESKLLIKHLKPKLESIKKILYLGFPSSLDQGSRALSMTIITFLVVSFGTIATASYGIGIKIIHFVLTPAFGFAIATTTMVGQNLGAKKKGRAKQTSNASIKIGFSFMAIMGLILFAFAPKIAGIFIPNDYILIGESVQFLRIISLTFGFIGIMMGINGTLRASGNTKTAMYITFATTLILLICAFGLSKFTSLGYLGIWLAFPISNLSGALIGLTVINKDKWVETKIT